MKKYKCRSLGFTLIELMIVIGIISILAAIAYPSYIEHVRKTRRADAQKDLMVLANFMERHFAKTSSYRDAGNPVTLPFTRSPRSGTNIFYNLSLSASTQFTYTLQAVPQGAQQDDSCGTLTIDHAGIKGAAEADCWE